LVAWVVVVTQANPRSKDTRRIYCEFREDFSNCNDLASSIPFFERISGENPLGFERALVKAPVERFQLPGE